MLHAIEASLAKHLNRIFFRFCLHVVSSIYVTVQIKDIKLNSHVVSF